MITGDPWLDAVYTGLISIFGLGFLFEIALVWFFAGLRETTSEGEPGHD